MAGHFCVREFQDVSPLPVLSGIEAVRAALARQGCRSVGVLGTRSVMTSGLFGGLDGLDVKLPNADGLDQTDRDYIAMARAGRATEKQRAFFLDMARRLHRDGAEVVLLAGTDLFLAFEGGACEVPTLDCATCHVEAMTQLTRERA
jgi:aspartate racemase